MSSSVDELVLLERVFLRVGSANSDEQLENSVSKFLTPVLLKLGSQHEDVRMKVLELLSHINKRVKTRPQVQLPIDSLLLQYQDTSSTPFITNFTIIYIKMGFPRLPQSKQAELIPLLLSSIENKPQAHKDSLLILAMTALGYIQWPSDPAKRKLFLNFHEKPIIVKQFSQVLLDTLLMPYGWGTIPPAPPGLSAYAYNRIVNELGHLNLTPEALEQLKLGVLKFLSSDAFSDEETFCPLVVAAADNRSIVASVAEAQLRKIIGSLDWESVSLLSPLYSVYLGSKEGPEDKHKAPATIRQRLKLLPFMTKARKQALLWPASIRVFFDSLYGENTHARLKTQALSFCSVIIQEVSVNQLSVVANVLMTSGLMKLISECEADMPGIRQQAYTVAGQLVSKVPSLVKNDLSLLQTLFTVLLQEENSDVRMSVRDALLTMVSAFKLDGSEQGEQLLSLLATQVESNSPSARLVAVRYLAIVFPPEHSLSRLQLLIASGDSQEEVSTEALKSLYGSSYRLSGGNIPAGLKFPQFSDITAVVSERACIRERNFNTRVSVGNHILPFTVSTYNQVLTYLSLCLAQSSGAKTSLQRLQHPCEASPQIGHFLRSLHDKNPELLDNYLKLVFKLLQANPDVVPMSSLLECVGCIPDLLSSTFVSKLEWIKNFLSDSREEMREIVAQLFGCIVGFGDENLRSLWLATLVNNLSNNTKDLELIHGTMLAIANIIERSITKHGLLSSEEHNKMSLLKIVPYLEHTQMMLVGAACNALALMSRVLPLPFTDSRIGDLNNPGKMDVVEKLLEIINSTKINSKIKERSCKAAGMLCSAENFPYRQYVVEKFIENGKEMKDVEIQLSVGEALVCCILGPTSPSIRDPWTLKEHILSIHYDPEPFCADLMDNILIKMLNVPHPHSRQACCIWLLAILKHCGHLTAVKQKLMEIQSAFMDLLSENNDIVQDVASKGLALVYESGDESLRTRLVELLVDQLTVGRRQVAQVTKDTKLFEDGSLGKSPTGGNLSTYQELCSLASDLNQPDLIYKFMHLANHNAIWNSKKGAAFGFSTIAKAAGEQLSSHLPKILPRLYRYQFDPTPKIQNSMAAIWQALVPETNKTVDLYHRAIFEDLITNLTANQWRVRTSCCLGLSDFLRGGGSKVFQDCIDLMPKLWSQLFRVMDDVHEGTRQAATSTTKIFSKLCVHSCDVESGKSGEQMVQTILPVLLETGICHQVAEIRGVSVHTVSQLVKSAGPLLRPHLPRLIPALLEAAGELEPMALNSLSVRLAADQRSQDIVDTLRASAAKSHYTTETVSKCVHYINVDILAVMLPRLQELLRSSIGLGTRVACAHFIVLLSHHLTIEEFQPYTGKLLGALVSGLTDRNTTIRKIYASAIGQLVRSAKSSSVDRLLVKLRTNYLEKEDESVRTAIGHTLQAMARHNQEMMKSRSELTLPLVFFAMHTAKIKEDPVSVSNWELWQDVWHELAPGTETALARHIDEICSLLSTVLQSASWHVKAQAARSIETVANKLGSSLEKERRDYLVSLLVTGLAGRTWDGKEHILSALATLCKNSAFLKGTEDGQIIVDAVLRECGKEKVSYKCEALSALGEILEALETDRFKQVYDLVQEILTTEMNTEENEDHQETSKRRGELLKLKETAFITLGKAWPHNINTQVEYRERVITQCVSCLETNTRSIQVTIVTALLNYCEKLSLFDNVSTTADEEALEVILVQIIKALNYSLSISKHTLLRKEALNVLFLLAKSFKVLQRTESLQRLSSVFNEHLEELSCDNAPEVKSRVVDIKDFFRQI